jgi:hypothetical protein
MIELFGAFMYSNISAPHARWRLSLYGISRQLMQMYHREGHQPVS